MSVCALSAISLEIINKYIYANEFKCVCVIISTYSRISLNLFKSLKTRCEIELLPARKEFLEVVSTTEKCNPK